LQVSCELCNVATIVGDLFTFRWVRLVLLQVLLLVVYFEDLAVKEYEYIPEFSLGLDEVNNQCLEVELISIGGIDQRLHCLFIEAYIRPSH
jgi:hypothetical protein